MLPLDSVAAVVARVAKSSSIDQQESLFDSGLLDSFSLSELITALEREFAITIPDSDLRPANFDSIAQIQLYLDSRIRASRQAGENKRELS